jgi:hypothetical protein
LKYFTCNNVGLFGIIFSRFATHTPFELSALYVACFLFF